MSGRRLPTGGRIDRRQRVGFTFDGRPLTGFAGDTLASALLANGVSLTGRSFKYHRPRGILSAGIEEPNALVTLGRGARRDPNVPATIIELAERRPAVLRMRRQPVIEFLHRGADVRCLARRVAFDLDQRVGLLGAGGKDAARAVVLERASQ